MKSPKKAVKVKKEILFLITLIIVFTVLVYVTLEAFFTMTKITVKGRTISIVSKGTLSILYIILVIYVLIFFGTFITLALETITGN